MSNCTSRWECCWLLKNSTRPARLELEKANALQPETFEILFNLGQTYLRSGGNYAKAELILNRALKLKPDSAETLYLLAQVYSEQNRRGRCSGFAGARPQARAGKHRHHLSAGPRQHDAELFRRRHPAAGIRLENRSQTRRSSRRAGRKLFHVRQGGESDRRVQNPDRARSLGAILRFSGTLVPPSGTLR